MADLGRMRGWSTGLSWNYVTLGIAAAAGLATNVFLAASYGSAGLGVFAQTLTFFILAAQLAVLGIHYAVLHEAAGTVSRDAQRRIVNVALTASLPFAAAIALVGFLAAPLIGDFVDSAQLIESIRYACGALVLHAGAKIVSAGLNGARRMVQFAAVNFARYVAMLLSAVAIGAIGLSVEKLGLVLVGSETAALLVALGTWGGARPAFSKERLRSLLVYGFRAAPGAVTVGINSRVDIVSLGFFASDALVGVYTLAATLYEGLFYIFVVLRNQVNPHVSAAVRETRSGDLESLQATLRPWTAGLTAAALLGALFLFDPALQLLGLDASFEAARGPLIVLLAGLFLASPLLPFDQTLLVSGQPAAQSWVVGISVSVNIGLNVLLVPTLGMYGAAVGTSCALVLLALGVANRAKSLLGIRLRFVPVGSGS